MKNLIHQVGTWAPSHFLKQTLGWLKYKQFSLFLKKNLVNTYIEDKHFRTSYFKNYYWSNTFLKENTCQQEKKVFRNSELRDIHCSHCNLSLLTAEIMEKMPSDTAD